MPASPFNLDFGLSTTSLARGAPVSLDTNDSITISTPDRQENTQALVNTLLLGIGLLVAIVALAKRRT